MSADYTRTIVFKVEDQAIKRATDRITRSLQNIEKILGKIEKRGFENVAKGADNAAKGIDRVSRSMGKYQNLQRRATVAGVGLFGAAGAASIGNITEAWNKFAQSGNIASKVMNAQVIPATKLGLSLKALGAFVHTHPAAFGAAAVMYMALGDKFVTLTKTSYSLGAALRKTVSNAIEPLNLKLPKTTSEFKLLNDELKYAHINAGSLEAVLKRIANTGLKGNLLRNRGRSRAGREGSGFADFSRSAGEYNPYQIRQSKGYGFGRGAGRDFSERFDFGITPSYSTGKIGPMHPAEFLNRNANPATSASLGKYDSATTKSIARHQRKQAQKDTKLLSQVAANTKISANVDKTQAGTGGGQGLFQGGMRGALSSAMIGGGFPLLFGQSPTAAIGGGLGGLIGGAMGGPFGFALSIVGTNLGEAANKSEEFHKSLARLNSRLDTSSGSMQVTSQHISQVAKQLGSTKEEALGVISAFSEFDSAGVKTSLASIFGTDTGGFDRMAEITRQSELAQEILASRKEIGNIKAKELLQQNLLVDGAVVELAFAEAKAQALNDQAVAAAEVVTHFDRMRGLSPGLLILRALGNEDANPSFYGKQRGENINKKFEDDRAKRIEDFKKKLEEVRELIGLAREAQGQFGQSSVLSFSAVNDKVKDLNDELKKLMNPIYTLISTSDVLASSFQQSFKGIINGTMSVGEAFANMFNKIADHFLDMAARMAAIQIQKGILSMFAGNWGNAPLGPLGNPLSQHTTKYHSGMLRADGGPVSGGSPYIVGEKGPELFVPGSSGNIVPNHAMGGANIVVNVDASGSSVEGDAGQAEQLGSMLAAAVQAELVNQQRPGGLLAGTR